MSDFQGKQSLRKNTKEENEARDLELYRAMTALNPWRPSEQKFSLDVGKKGGGDGMFRFVKGMVDQRWVRNGDPVIQDNSFYRSLAQSHGGNQSLWPIYKYQIHAYLSDVLDIQNTHLLTPHPRAILYTILNGHAGGRTSEHLSRKPADLIQQTEGSSTAPVSSEMFQIVSDLYNIELILFFLRDNASAEKPHGVVTRGQHMNRQVFLSCYIPPNEKTELKAFYQPVLPAVEEPWDFKFIAHMEGDRIRRDLRRCPFIFQAGKRDERVMPGVPDGWERSPPKPVFPLPVPVTVSAAELQVFFKGYRGPDGEGKKLVLGPAGLMKRGSVKRAPSIGRSDVSGRSSITGRTRTPSIGQSTPPTSGRSSVTGRTRTPSLGKSDTPIRPPTRTKTSVTGHSKTLSVDLSVGKTYKTHSVSRPPISEHPAFASRSRTASINSKASTTIPSSKSPCCIVPNLKAVANRLRSGSSISKPNQGTTTPETPITNRSRTSSVSNKKTSLNGRSRTSSVTGPTPVPTTTRKLTKTRKVSTVPPQPQQQYLPYSNIPALTSSTNLDLFPQPPQLSPKRVILPNHTRTRSGSSSIPAPRVTNRRDSFSRTEVVCRNRSPEAEVEGGNWEVVGDDGDDYMEVFEEGGLKAGVAGGSARPVQDRRRPPPSWAHRNRVGYGEVPGDMKPMGRRY